MPESARHIIAVLRAAHGDLAGRVARMSDGDLARTSGARDWTVAQVLSHLGSGAEIAQGTLVDSLGGSSGDVDTQAIWDRWNAMSPQEQASGFVSIDEQFVATYEGMTDEELDGLRVDLGFLPDPVDAASLLALRLNEVTLHHWDVVVAFEPDTGLRHDAVPELLDRAGLLFGMISHADQVQGTPTLLVKTTSPERSFGVAIGDTASLVDSPVEPDAVLEAPAEAWLRLVAGRLTPTRTPSEVAISGDLSLDDLRRVFPGY